MRIVEIREVAVHLDQAIANAVVDFSRHTISLVALVSDQVRNGRAVCGVAFNSIGRFAQSGIVQDRLIPRIAAMPPEDYAGTDGTLSPARLARAMMRDEKPGGHGDRASAIAAIELAAWDLKAKLLDEPAFSTVARAFGRDHSIGMHVYAAGGYYHPDDGINRLRGELNGYREAGFTDVKIKIGGAPWSQDAARIEAAIEVFGSAARVAVDANGRFGRTQATGLGRELAQYGLRWYEEPCDPLDYSTLRELSQSYPHPLATGENLFSLPDSINLLRYGGMRPGVDIFQMDAGLSYGLTEYAGIIAALEAAGHDRSQAMPHGGHMINLHIVAGLNLGGCEAYPAVFQPFGGYLPDLVIENGMINLPQQPGFGLEFKPELAPHIERLIA
ncbi:MAG: hypothetical protein KGL48_15690 [Sphingomonadales bacterium]|nr:hypothetical protein [Sphingomonadales bacterium]MDE2567283.1 hypothetical protein [Sphingomonadales bacterium]